jgi:hypothetical protein
MDMDFVGDGVQLNGQVFNRRLYEENIREAPFRRFPMNFFGYFLQGAGIRVDPYEELPRVGAGALVYKETVAGPYVYHHSLACKER